MTKEFYQQRALQFENKVNDASKLLRINSWLRIASAFFTLAFIYLSFSDPVFIIGVSIFIIIFFFLVQRQTRLEDTKNRFQFLAKLNRQEEKASDNSFQDFADGNSFSDPHHFYAHDLDLFGPSSLFQYLNRCATQLGEEQLAYDLKNLQYDRYELIQRQEAVKEVAPLIDFRQNAWAIGRQISDFSFNRKPLEQWLNEKSFVYHNRVNTLLMWVLPAISVGLMALVIYDFSYFNFLFPLMAIQLTLTGIHNKRITKMQNALVGGKAIMESYSKIFKLMNDQWFSSEWMTNHKQKANEAADEVKKFSLLVNTLESRMNAIARMFGNGLFMFDFHSVNRLERWKEKNAENFSIWLKSLAEWDALLSLATFCFNNSHYAFANFTTEMKLSAKQAGHPLIPPKECVYNDITLGDPLGIMLITGANMAGKSTFLRTMGVNFILARIGSPVCATAMTCPMVELRSGMRTSDSLQEHQSYFFAELHRLQAIMEELKAGKRLFLLLDEILKGTNSTDKQLGSRELLKQLMQYNTLVLLATHDIALGDLEMQHPQHIVNACFEGSIKNDRLFFDYKLHKGVATKANATFLMQQMGIIPKIQIE